MNSVFQNEKNGREFDRFVHMQSISDLNFISARHNEDCIFLSYKIRDSDLRYEYEFLVLNQLMTDEKDLKWQKPVLKLIAPILKVNLDIHLLSDGIICYTFPGDILYNKGITCGYAVEQSIKWAFGHEHYLRKQRWPFTEMPHGIYPNRWGFSRPSLVA